MSYQFIHLTQKSWKISQYIDKAEYAATLIWHPQKSVNRNSLLCTHYFIFLLPLIDHQHM